MIKVGEYNDLKVLRQVEFGLYLEGTEEGILLPKRFVTPGTKVDDTVRVLVYHDSENRLIATTQKPIGVVGDIVKLRCVEVTPAGAFMDWGLMKDIFVPKSKQLMGMMKGGDYLVQIYVDEQTGRVAATEKFDYTLSNEVLTVKELEVVNLTAYRRTDLGYVMIINHKHTGLLHFNEIYRNISVGDSFEGYIKKIYPEENKIDVVLGRPGYQRVEDETDKIMRLLDENNGYLPFHDKSDPQEIYDFFGMSKKTFKMSIGKLYKEKKVELTKTGFKKV